MTIYQVSLQRKNLGIIEHAIKYHVCEINKTFATPGQKMVKLPLPRFYHVPKIYIVHMTIVELSPAVCFSELQTTIPHEVSSSSMLRVRKVIPMCLSLQFCEKKHISPSVDTYSPTGNVPSR